MNIIQDIIVYLFNYAPRKRWDSFVSMIDEGRKIGYEFGESRGWLGGAEPLPVGGHSGWRGTSSETDPVLEILPEPALSKPHPLQEVLPTWSASTG